MIELIREKFIVIITNRLTYIIIFILVLAGILCYRLFDLQIINGQSYLDNFMILSQKIKTIENTRGNIYDRNGELLAYNELAYTITFEDVFDSTNKSKTMNETLDYLIDIIEENDENVITDLYIKVNEYNEYEFTVSNTTLLRFLADIYGHKYIEDLLYEEKTATAQDVMDYLCGTSRYSIGEYEMKEDGTYEVDENGKKIFLTREGYTKQEALQIASIRYSLSLISYQKYLGTTVAVDVSEKTVATVMENLDQLNGVTVEEETVRRYVDSIYFSQVIGYTGKISSAEELETLNETIQEIKDTTYSMTDIVGRSGIEAYMEAQLQGIKGSETVYVDVLGKVISTTNQVDAVAGNDVYLTIDKELTIAAYKILEQNIAGILLDKIQNIKTYVPGKNDTSSDIIIPIYDVYFALFDNGVIDIDALSSGNAQESEAKVYNEFVEYKENLFHVLEDELYTKLTPYNKLSDEYKVYQSNIVIFLESNGVLMKDSYDTTDKTLIAWKTDETISLNEFLKYAISQGWVDNTKLDYDSQYSDTDEVYDKLVQYIFDYIDDSASFQKRFYKYMLLNGEIQPIDVCYVICEQNKVDILNVSEIEDLYNKKITPYNFIINRIENLEITPSQLALDPYSGSVVINDVNTGEVLALVSYPSYDNNKMANTVDAEYFAQITSDLSSPLINYATQYRSAPGSIYKMVSATAALSEGIITDSQMISCLGIFDEINPSPKCWIYPGSHGSIDVSGAIQNSCNYFFYTVGYDLSCVSGKYVAEDGLSALAKYASLYGLGEKSGVEIDEWAPKISDELPVPSAIGQGTNNFTSVGLAKYISTVANKGTCYDLTLIDKVTDFSGNLLFEQEPSVYSTIDLSETNWMALHEGMLGVVEKKTYFSEVGVLIAGKTGTAQESTSRAPHALFVGFAPYENPEITIVTRIAFGYASDYAAQTTKDVLSYYYESPGYESIITGKAKRPNVATNLDEY